MIFEIINPQQQSLIAHNFQFPMKKNNKKNSGKQLRKPVAQGFAPKRLAINYEPPMIIIEYLVIDTGKLYHHKMRLDSVLKRNDVKRQDILNYLKMKHYLYFIQGKITNNLLYKFIDKILLRKGLITKSGISTPKQELAAEPEVAANRDLDYLNDEEDEYYEQDYQDYEMPFNPKIEAKQKSNNNNTKPPNNAFLTYCQEYEKDEGQQNSAQASWDLDMDDDADFV